jgi:hypothetical protein
MTRKAERLLDMFCETHGVSTRAAILDRYDDVKDFFFAAYRADAFGNAPDFCVVEDYMWGAFPESDRIKALEADRAARIA